MRARTVPGFDDLGPEAISDLFRRAGLRACERRVASPTGPRCAVLLHAVGADLWVEAGDWAGAWRKAACYAREVGLLK